MTTLLHDPPQLQLDVGEPLSDADLPSIASAECVAFAAWIDAQADRYARLGTPAGDWLARRISELAVTARVTLAGDPATFDEREAAMIASHHDDIRVRAYDSAFYDSQTFG